MEGACKNDRKIKILNGPETVKEGTPRGDTTTNLRNFSPRIFLVSTEDFKKQTLGRLCRKHDKYLAILQLFWKLQTPVETAPIFVFSVWELSILNLKGATSPIEPMTN